MDKITVSGGFHNAGPLTLHVRNGELSAGQWKRYRSHLCGISGCKCSKRHDVVVDGMPRDKFFSMMDEADYKAFTQ